MFQLIALHVLISMTVVTSVTGAICLLRGSKIFNLRIGTRNFMYVGACCALSSGFFGAIFCAGLQAPTQWHYVAATALFAIALFATAHIFVDLSDRLRILKRSKIPEEAASSLPPAPTAKVYNNLYRLNFGK